MDSLLRNVGRAWSPRESCRVGASGREHPIAELILVFQSAHHTGRHQFRTCLATRVVATEAWVEGGFTPNWRPLLVVPEVNGHQGEWVLVEGFIRGTDESHDREIFAFLRGVFIARREIRRSKSEVPCGGVSLGIARFPGGDTEYYLYAGRGRTSSELCATPLPAEQPRYIRQIDGSVRSIRARKSPREKTQPETVTKRSTFGEEKGDRQFIFGTTRPGPENASRPRHPSRDPVHSLWLGVLPFFAQRFLGL